jgi:prohibitin 2
MKKVWYFAIMFAALGLNACGFKTIDEGHRGLEKRFGQVIGDQLSPGLHFYNPLTSSIIELDIKEHAWEGEESCFTADTQEVKVKFTATVYPKQEQVRHLYSQFGEGWDNKIIPQILQSAIKDVIGQYRADDIIAKRDQARTKAFEELQKALEERGLTATRLDFTNLDFNDEYEKAVEAKVVATQKALEAKNKSVQIQEEANQKIMSAKADAESMRIKSQALQQNKGLVQYEAVQKWDGHLPSTMLGNSTPIINLDSLRKSE